jgi:hypothetical protein
MSVIKFPAQSRKIRRECGVLERAPMPIMHTSGDDEDPIFAVIDHHRALSSRYTKAVKQYGRMENGPLEEEAIEIVNDTHEDLLDFSDKGLLLRKPTTLAGVAAFIGYVVTLEEWECVAFEYEIME